MSRVEVHSLCQGNIFNILFYFKLLFDCLVALQGNSFLFRNSMVLVCEIVGHGMQAGVNAFFEPVPTASIRIDRKRDRSSLG